MPRQEYVLRVFVGSPSDVKNERGRLEEVISELNETGQLGIRFDLVRWETKAYPGIGEDSQAVINEQILDDYDVFIGIMWHRLGTPTGRAESGTVEEYQHALQRYKEDHSSVNIMLYFKDEPIPPSDIDTDQLAGVNAFKQRVATEGALYWPFTSVDDFEKTVRMHLISQGKEWLDRLKSGATSIPTTGQDTGQIAATGLEAADEDLGLIDAVALYEERFAELTNIVQRITAATQEIGITIDVRTQNIEDSVSTTGGQISRNLAKRLIARIASDMDQYVSRIEAETPLFGKNIDEGMIAFAQAASIAIEMETSNAGQDTARQNLAATWLKHSESLPESNSSQLRQTLTSTAPFGSW
jgi:hypothetical protein